MHRFLQFFLPTGTDIFNMVHEVVDNRLELARLLDRRLLVDRQAIPIAHGILHGTGKYLRLTRHPIIKEIPPIHAALRRVTQNLVLRRQFIGPFSHGRFRRVRNADIGQEIRVLGGNQRVHRLAGRLDPFVKLLVSRDPLIARLLIGQRRFQRVELGLYPQKIGSQLLHAQNKSLFILTRELTLGTKIKKLRIDLIEVI